MFNTTDNRARFIDKAHDHQEPRDEDRFNEVATPKLVDWLSRSERWFTNQGMAHQFYAIVEATFEEIGWPSEHPTTWTSVDHDACIRIRDRARRAWKERREQAA